MSAAYKCDRCGKFFAKDPPNTLHDGWESAGIDLCDECSKSTIYWATHECKNEQFIAKAAIEAFEKEVKIGIAPCTMCENYKMKDDFGKECVIDGSCDFKWVGRNNYLGGEQ